MKCNLLRAAGILVALISSAVLADAPPSRPKPIQTICAGTPQTGACATIDRRKGLVTIRRRRPPQAVMWRMAGIPSFIELSSDGRFLVDEHRPGGLIEPTDSPDTNVLTLWENGTIIRRVSLRDLGLATNELPTTISHRVWSRARYFAGPRLYVVVAPSGRKLRFDLTDKGRMLQTDR